MGIKLGNGKWATKEDELLAYRVIEGKYFNRSFDFARSSTTTRVNKDGYIEDVPSDTARIDFADSVDGALLTEPASTNLITYPISFGNNYWTKSGASIEGDSSTAGSELVTNGSFATDTDWTKGTGWSIGSGVATYTGTTDSNLGQSSVATVGTFVLLEYEVTSSSIDGTLDLSSSSFKGAYYSLNKSVGTHQFYIEVSTYSTLNIRVRSNTTGTISIDNVSVKEVQGFEAPKVDGSGGFERDAYKLVESTNTGVHSIHRSFISGISLATDYTWSVYAKADERNFISLVWIYGGSDNLGVQFNLTTGEKVYEYQNGTGYSVEAYSITALVDGWYKLTMTGQSGKTDIYPSIFLSDAQWTTGSHLTNTYTGTLGYGVKIAYSQMEQSSYASSLMLPTSEGSTTSRVADACTGSGTAQDFKDYNASGVLYAEIAANSDDLTDRYITIGDGGTSNRVEIRYRSASNQIYVAVRVGGTYVSTMSYFVSDITDFHKVALKWNTDDFALWVDGVERVTDNSGVTFSAGTLSNMSLAGTPSGGADFYGKTRAVEVLPYMSDTEMSLLTSP